MYKFESAKIHYGVRSYPMNGLAVPQEISDAADIDAEKLAIRVGQLTGYPREFEVKEVDEINVELPDGKKIHIAGCIHAMANGYSIIWRKQ